MKELQQVSVGCEGAILASDSLCADVVTSEGKSLRFERVGFNSFGANATNVVVSEAAGLVPRIASCESVSFPNFHRSEEHTSELQSQSNLVCRLLLEKKK